LPKTNNSNTFAFTRLVYVLPVFDLSLLALGSAGFLLAFTFGIQKIVWYVMAFHSGKPFSSIGLAPLIAKVGFPMPVILALWITFNESVDAFLVGCGLFTRALAISAALGMAGALYTSVRFEDDWLRAALYLIVFVTLSLAGAGRFSIDRWVQIRNKNKCAAAAPPHKS
jgi:uncharacterized membrane protein YphA (DoxX/SURF4 family)